MSSPRIRIDNSQILQSTDGTASYTMEFRFAVQSDVVRYLGTNELLTVTEAALEGMELRPTGSTDTIEISFVNLTAVDNWTFNGRLESNNSRVILHRNNRQIRLNQYRWQLA